MDPAERKIRYTLHKWVTENVGDLRPLGGDIVFEEGYGLRPMPHYSGPDSDPIERPRRYLFEGLMTLPARLHPALTRRIAANLTAAASDDPTLGGEVGNIWLDEIDPDAAQPVRSRDHRHESAVRFKVTGTVEEAWRAKPASVATS